jgi:hypothetical protein
MANTYHTPGPWDAEGLTVMYTGPSEADAATHIEIRANVTEAGWETVAFIEAIWANAAANARLIKESPQLLDALLNIKCLAEKSGDHEADPFTLVDLIADEARAAVLKALGHSEAANV